MASGECEEFVPEMLRPGVVDGALQPFEGGDVPFEHQLQGFGQIPAIDVKDAICRQFDDIARWRKAEIALYSSDEDEAAIKITVR
ncbi:hypothetical protein GCM10028812_27260 [Ancylobacter sonchi]